AGTGRPPRRSVRSLHRAGVSKAGDAEDPSPLSRLATIGRQGSLAVVLGVVARRLDVRAFGGRGATIEPAIPPADRLDRSRSLGQEGGEAKIASGWPPGSIALYGRPFLPGCSMSAHSVKPSMSQQ